MMNRDEYIQKMKSQLDTWNAELAKLEAKARETQTQMHSEYAKQFEAFNRQRDVAMEQMKQMQASAGDAWMDLTRGADEAWAKMRESLEKARSHFNK